MTWLLYAVGATLMIAAAPVLAKAGAKKSDAALSSGISGLAVLVMLFVIAPGSLNGFSLNSFSTKSLLCLVLSGVTIGLAAYCFFTAISNGELINVAPLAKCNIVITLVAGIFLWHNKLDNMLIAKIVLIVVGTVVMIIGAGKKNYKWLIYGILSAVCISASKLIIEYGMGTGISNTMNAVRIIIAVILLFAIGIGTGGIKKFKTMTFLDGIYLILSGVSIGIFRILYTKATLLAGALMAETFYRFELFATVILAGILLKEKLNGRNLLGALVIVAALFL